jgi:hypothetical protein
MLAERFRCTHAVGKLKAQHGLPSRAPGREVEQIRSAVCGISRRSANSTQTLLRSCSPLSLVKWFATTNCCHAQSLKVYEGISMSKLTPNQQTILATSQQHTYAEFVLKDANRLPQP